MTSHSTGRPTRAQAMRMALLAQLPCWCCWGLRQPNRTEVHHIVDKGYRIHSGGHWATLPLCGWHHRGVPLSATSTRRAEDIYGPSLALAKRRFVERYGTEREILARVNAQITRYDFGHEPPYEWPGVYRIASALVVVEWIESERGSNGGSIARFPR